MFKLRTLAIAALVATTACAQAQEISSRIIATDTLGNGRAISPSNSETQPGMKFPQFSIRDMVNAQHQLVAEGLELDRLLAVVGLSMGGMQTYQWGASFPDEMAALIPIVSMGRTSPWVTAIWEGSIRVRSV